MRSPINLFYTELLIRNLESDGFLGRDELTTLEALYTMKAKLVTAHLREDKTTITKIKYTESLLAKKLMHTLVNDPSMIIAKPNPDIDYKISGYNVTFKADTGAITSVVDAKDIQWPLADEQRKNLEAAYESYVAIYPDSGAMTHEVLPKLPKEFRALDFGKVEDFNLVIFRKGKDKQEDAKFPDATDDILVKFHGPYDVVGISNPKVKGERAELRPVVNLPIEGAGFPGRNKTHPFALVARNMTRRGLASRNLMARADLSIVFSEAKTRMLDATRVHLSELRDILEPYNLDRT